MTASIRSAIVLLSCVLTTAVPAAARQLPPPPPPPPMPPREAVRPVETGTAMIKGRVLTADGRPLRRAQIRTLGGSSDSKITSTNSRGEYQLSDLPAGRYVITVSRNGYLPAKYGERRVGEPARPIDVADGAVVDKIDISLQRAGAISGLISDETGEPVAGVSVWPMQTVFFRGRKRLVPYWGGTQTDDTGQYRIVSLPPGEYIIMANLLDTWKTRGKDPQVLGYAPSYFPGTANARDAQRVKVTVGQEVAAVDFTLVPGRASTVSGTFAHADGSPIAGADVYLTQELTGPTGSSFRRLSSTRSGPDGRWVLKDVSPGEYKLGASGSDTEHGSEGTSMAIALAGNDLTGVSLVPDAPAIVSGQVVTDDGQPLPAGLNRMRVVSQTVKPDEGPTQLVTGDANGAVGANGRFTLRKVNSPAVLFVFDPPRGWALKNIDVGGRDGSRVPITLGPREELAGVRVVLTRSFHPLTGRITNEAGDPADGVVLLFPRDAALWFEALKTTRTVRPDQAGKFAFDAVRPGDYLVVAVESLLEWEANDPEFLESLRRRATPLTIGDEAPAVLVLQVQK